MLHRNKDSETATGKWLSELFSSNPWFKDILPYFRETPKKDLPKGIDNGRNFGSLCIDTMIYTAYLKGQCFKQGVVFKRAVIKHISDAGKHHHSGQKVDVIVNCTGLLARKLGGVMDLDVIPVRGMALFILFQPFI